MLKVLLLLKRLVKPTYYSCNYLENGINFYPNNVIKTCCFTSSPKIDLCKINGDNYKNIDKIILKNKKRLKNDFKKGLIPDCCKSCECLVKKDWKNQTKIRHITLNHFMYCNLKCKHCGYYKNVRFKVKDTDDKLVLDVLKYLESKGVLAKDYELDVGGGEPSLSKGLDEIIEYVVGKNHKIHINSNVAMFKENYVKYAKKDLIYLTLTPDAGSRKVYKEIKGADYFDIVKENLKKYMSKAADKIEVKFIIEEGNVTDIENMVKLCKDCSVKNVVCSLDLNIPREEYDIYRPYVLKFKNLCIKNGLNYKNGIIQQDFLIEKGGC